MNREEKEAVAALSAAAVLAAVVCVLSFQTCVLFFMMAAAAGLWAYVWSKVFGEGLEEIRKRQMQSHDRSRCVADN
jgi:membrane protein implicated in regulation of membrane protease activity